MMRPNKAYIVDTETTGLDNTQDEILQVSIIDLEGSVVYNKYFKPKEHTEWKDAATAGRCWSAAVFPWTGSPC